MHVHCLISALQRVANAAKRFKHKLNDEKFLKSRLIKEQLQAQAGLQLSKRLFHERFYRYHLTLFYLMRICLKVWDITRELFSVKLRKFCY